MKKQELIKRIEQLFAFGSRDYIERNEVLNLVKQLDEPKKVTIPQFVVEIIEYYKGQNATLYDGLREKNFNKQYNEWLMNEQDAYDKVARAWLNGYEVEKEKRYLVKIKGIDPDFDILKYNLGARNWFTGSRHKYSSFRLHHTRKELEDAGFGWVFDCEGVEVEEVDK
ncbi:DUF1642 domain-containing protein [Streptococcus cristatus]|uniref:DUF1642 domain-containing protein n=1 Tax=Streptococcus cristatus TaxID=45634 RepID=UPI000660F85B|nr:DUF1642 domain-containing protein [Streptococcus cristatus]